MLLAGILGLEILVRTAIPGASTLLGPFAPFLIISYAVFLGLGYSHFKRQKQDLPFSVGFFLAHMAFFLFASLANIALLPGFASSLASDGAHLLLRIVFVVAIALLAVACIPLRVWIATIRETKWLWLYATLAGAFSWCLRYPLQSMWEESNTAPGRVLEVITFHSVKAVLRVFLPDIAVDPQTFTIGTPRFSVIIAEACSGLEGIGLVLVFTILWLWYFRKESRFPQALLLVPCALGCVWMLNILRISTLVLIGNAGHADVAMVGFHSQAGWIAFTAVAFTFSMATRKIPWVRRVQHYSMPSAAARPGTLSSGVALSNTVPPTCGPASVDPISLDREKEETGESPATGAYLVPFLAILAASFLSKAASGYFEWLYPLRFLAAVIAIWCYWPELKQINWRFGWLAPVTGAAIFAVWLAPTFWSQKPETSTLGTALAALSPPARWAWIAFRVAAAVLTVPVAEELAFRGYLARRLVNRNFDAIPFSAVTVLSVCLSSVVFGIMHGQQWIVGIVAGLAYAGLLKWRGRIGDAIIAHATTNLLLAVWVLSRGDWSQW